MRSLAPLLLTLIVVLVVAGCRVFELGGEISCELDGQCPQGFGCVEGRCLTPAGEAPAEGEGEGDCRVREDCADRPGCIGCVCDDGECVAPCEAGGCGAEICFNDGLCHAPCEDDTDCGLREYCAFTGSIFDPVLACFAGCSNDSGCDAGQICSRDHTCVPGTARSKAAFEPCAGPSECLDGLACFTNGYCGETCDAVACGDDPGPCCPATGLSCGAGLCTRFCLDDGDCPGAGVCDTTFNECRMP